MITRERAVFWIPALGCAGGLTLAAGVACTSGVTPKGGALARPSILLVTLDTTRADAIGPESAAATPGFNGLAARGLRFRRAYTTAPETLPAHSSLMTGLLPAGHGIHENGRSLAADRPVLAAQLRTAGYRTAAVVSAFVLARRFGLARGFETYDDGLPAGAAERGAGETTDRALAALAPSGPRPLFLWVHYFDPHAPYAPAEPFRSRHPDKPYLGEIEAMDAQLDRLLRGFAARAPGPTAVVVVGDHGEGLGDHGESQHGALLYESTVRVPLAIAGPGVAAGVRDEPVSTRRVFHTIRGWAGLGAESSMLGPETEIVLGEAMKPFLAYGWQPQVMAVAGQTKAILAGRIEAYDVAADPGETRDQAGTARLTGPLRSALGGYPIPSTATPVREASDEETRRRLASLGYVSAGASPVHDRNAPRPADRVRLLDVLEEASGLFVSEEYARAIPLFQRILREDARNLDAALRLATAHSSLGHLREAEKAFDAAAAIAPDSPDVRAYRALHVARTGDGERAAPLLERVLAETPERVPALEALSVVRERQGRTAEALGLRRRLYDLRAPSPAESLQMGHLAMRAGETTLALESFERVRETQGNGFANDLELGVLYLAAHRYPEARDCLDRVGPRHSGYPMALFKRAQVSVLLHEPDQAARIAAARERADAVTRPLIERERLFR